MFGYKRTSNKVSYEPKTPKMTSVSLPDERYTPIEAHIAYMEKPRGHSVLRHASHNNNRGTSPMLDAWAPRPEIMRSRTRTVSTPVRDVQAPRPIRPHPSQGGFIPVTDSDRIRRDHSRGPRVPVGVPSAAFLEEQVRRSRAESHSTPSSRTPIDMKGVPGEFSDEEYRTPESKRLRELAKRNGTMYMAHTSKAVLDELNAQQRRENKSRNSLTPSLKKQRSRPPIEKSSSTKEVVDFDEWEAVPLDSDWPYEPKPVDKNAPLKPALKKSSSLKPTPRPTSLKSALKKTEPARDSSGYYSENDSSRPKSEDKMNPIRVLDTPSKAFLDEQKAKLAHIKQRGWASRAAHPQARPEIRPSGFGHSNSSSTASPTDSIVYDQHGRLVRSRRPSVSETPMSSNYLPAYIKETPAYTPRAMPPDIAQAHLVLSWPLVEYALRKRDPYPLITFDAGFDPRDRKYAVKAKRGYHSTPLTREEMDIPVVYSTIIPEMVIVNEKLHLWPIHLKNANPWHTLRIIDVFRAIYDTYAQPLTPQELTHFGKDYIRRCQPAFTQRCQDSSQFTHIEERRGLLRIDLLRGRRIFKGLVPIPGRPLQWELLFDEGH